MRDETKLILKDILEKDEAEKGSLRRQSRHRFWVWLFLNLIYWGYIIYALVTGCPFFFGDLNLIQQLMGFITVIFAPFMPVTYYAILGLFLTMGLSSSFDKLH